MYGRQRSQRVTAREEATQTAGNGRRAAASREQRQPTPEVEEAASSSDEDENAEFETQLRSPPRLQVTETVKKNADLIPKDELVRKAADLARYALACEYQRMPIRMENAKKDVLVEPKYSRVFSVIFNQAQKLLQQTFGYHMVEVRAKGVDNAELDKQAEAAIREVSSQANGLRSRNKERDTSPETLQTGRTNTNMWILRSALPPKITKALVQVNAGLIEADGRSINQEPAISWSCANHQGGEMGLLYIILAIILVNGRIVSDSTLISCLRRLKLPIHDQLPHALRGTGPSPGIYTSGTQSTQSTARARNKQGTLDSFLASMVKQSYLEKQRSDTTDSTQPRNTAPGRGRASRAAADNENTVWDWRWGNRSEIEIGEKRIANMISDIFLDPSACNDGPIQLNEDDAQTRAVDRANLRKRKRVLLDNIASVAGSQLIE